MSELLHFLNPEFLLETFGTLFFAVSCFIIFAETGLLFGFFLPGDSLLFALGLFIATGQIDVPLWLAVTLLAISAFAGDQTGYWIGRPFWGRGFATEALEGALVWAGKRWKRRALLAGHFADNPASGRVLEKAGFLYTGETRKRFSRARGTPVDTRMMVWLA
jgi:membrane protein DedA with SNARE-associated domain